MISTIEIRGPATFLDVAKLTTNKKINLIYGLNGTGKSTICRYLRSPSAPEFASCKLVPPQYGTIYVYNDDFVRENFYESETFKGIFSLSKENKDAERRIESATQEKAALTTRRLGAQTRKQGLSARLQRAKQTAEDALWEIKTSFAGGDRVLEYCVGGLKGKKDTLFSYALSIPKPAEKPASSVEGLKSEAQALSADDARPVALIPRLSINASEIESDGIFETSILGSQDSIVSDLIQKLGNSDWVRQGLTYAEHPAAKADSRCPFCQSKTLDETLLTDIKNFFDDRYQQAVDRVAESRAEYQILVEAIPSLADLKDHPFVHDRLLLEVEKLRSVLKANLASIDRKGQSPAAEIILSESGELTSSINREIDLINEKVNAHNEKLKNKANSLAEIKFRFWNLMRWNYDHIIARFISERDEITAATESEDSELRDIDAQLRTTEKEIANAQKETVNIDEAVENINQALLELGIDDFSIAHHGENLYRLKRSNNHGDDRFSTLSEGEKMVITLLYFCELCKGRRSATDTEEEKIVVFDDPISSLSNLYLFNIGQLIRSTFFKSNVAKQIFVFTHSLYFFYELADPNHERRKEHQALFRISKRNGRSRIDEMKYDEIQNDYQAYWQVVNSKDQHPALIANCMRNIIDHFFSFVEKLDFNNVFQTPALRENRFQAFSRYMNRESHSFGQNIYDLKEFDYDVFKDGLRLVFEGLGYHEHYRKMSSL